MASAVVSLGLMELLRTAPGLVPISARPFVQTSPESLGVAHPSIGHLHTPRGRRFVETRDCRVVHDTDGHGFCNAWPWPKHTGVVAVGDLLTFGHGVTADQAWPSILARALPGSSTAA